MEHLGTWQHSPYRDGHGPTFALDLWDTGRETIGKSRLAYALTADGAEVFAGEDYGCSPMHSPDSDAAAGALLGFLSLRPGDTDPDYFADYSPAQLAFANAHGETLALWAMDLEQADDDDDLDAYSERRIAGCAEDCRLPIDHHGECLLPGVDF